jgi:hypothetical protein
MKNTILILAVAISIMSCSPSTTIEVVAPIDSTLVPVDTIDTCYSTPKVESTVVITTTVA